MLYIKYNELQILNSICYFNQFLRLEVINSPGIKITKNSIGEKVCLCLTARVVTNTGVYRWTYIERKACYSGETLLSQTWDLMFWVWPRMGSSSVVRGNVNLPTGFAPLRSSYDFAINITDNDYSQTVRCFFNVILYCISKSKCHREVIS